MGISPPRVQVGRVLDGRYSVVRPLGDPAEGLLSVRDQHGSIFTLKVFEQPGNPNELAEQLRADAVISARPDHPNLIPVLDIGVAPELNRAFVVLPGLDGSDVRRAIADAGPFDPAQAVRITLAACSGVGALHACGIIPRAIRPADLRLEPADGEIAVRILALDPVLRIDADADLISGSEILPARAYLSPELFARANGSDMRSNVWALGACLYFMLTGSPPCAETTGGEIPNVQELAPWIEPGLAVALHLALLVDPEKRWPTTAAFKKALTPFAGGASEIEPQASLSVSADTRGKNAEVADLKSLSAIKLDPSSSITETSHSSTGLFRRLAVAPSGLSALIGHKLDGRYEVLAPLGKGGMGAVFEVRGPNGEIAAAKLIDRRQVGETEETYKRFVREAKAASSLTGDHVVRIIEAGIDESLHAPFILMERLHGVDLRMVLRANGALEPEPVVRLFVQAAKGIATAHKQRIVHRDIKPANLFLDEQPDGRVVVKVCDFGIAKRTVDADGETTATAELTRTGGMLGSPLYMSPEQATNARNVDHRTDIWSLCISLYEALSGTKPFGGRSALGEIIVAICTQPVPPIRRAAPWIDRRLAEVIHRGLKPELAERWSTMEEVIAALEPFTGGTDELRADELVPVSREQKALKPSSIPPPASVNHEAATVIGVKTGDTAATQTAPSARRKSRAWLSISAIAIAATLAIAFVARREHPAPIAEPAKAAPAPEPAAAAAQASTEARLKIVPPEAEVSVNGQPARAVDGTLLLQGVPGTSFDIVLTLASGAKRSGSVVITRDGAASPDTLEVRDEAAEKPAAKPTGAKRSPAGRTDSTPAANAAKPPSEATPKPATDATQKPDFKTDW